MFSVFLLSFALALDAFSVSVIEGALTGKRSFNLALKLATTFGIFQTGLALLGYFFSTLFGSWFENIDHWIAFTLLTLIGLHMLHGAFKKDKDEKKRVLSLAVLLLLALATSIDAWVAGVTLGTFAVEVQVSVIVIGLVTFVLCLLGALLGQAIVPLFKRVKPEAWGGVLLIFIGLQTLIGQI